MMAQPALAIAATADRAAGLGVLFAVAGGFFTIGIHYYFRLTGAAERLIIDQTRQRIRRSERFRNVPRVGRLLWLLDIACVLGLRASALMYLGFVWYLVVPLLMTIGSIALAA